MGNNEMEVAQRQTISDGMKHEIISALQNLFYERNQMVRLFKTSLDQMPAENYQIIIRADKTPAGEHERRFNAPTIDEVAVVMIGTEVCNRRDIVLEKRDENLQRIAETHRSYDALQYPILFWEREDGYHFHMYQINPVAKAITTKKVSSMDFKNVQFVLTKNIKKTDYQIQMKRIPSKIVDVGIWLTCSVNIKFWCESTTIVNSGLNLPHWSILA